jgi:glutamate racemase
VGDIIVSLSTRTPILMGPAPRNADAPIGIFDSGIGGLSVMREVRALMPAEDLIYYADCAFCPYGTRPAEEISVRCLAIGEELVTQGAKALIVACNTACAVALPELRDRFDVPIIGLEPAVKPATLLTRTQRVAVLATPRTVASERLANLIRNYAHDVVVKTVPAPGLVELVENGQTDGPEVERTLRHLLEPLLAWDIDVVVLGCTHYPFLRREIQRLLGSSVQIVDSGEAIARRTRVVLDERGLGRDRDGSIGSLSVLTSGDADQVGTVSSQLLGLDVAATAMRV